MGRSHGLLVILKSCFLLKVPDLVIMLKKINRQDCLATYSIFPTRYYDPKEEDEVMYFPEPYATYWIKPEKKTSSLEEDIALEVEKLYNALNIRCLIFLCDFDSTWITSNALCNRNNKALQKSIDYLRTNKVNEKFNGGISVDKDELRVFIESFFTLTRYDSTFSDYYFTDEDKTMIGYIHYSGEVRIDALTEQFNSFFLRAVKQTNFVDAFRRGTSRL